MVFPHREPTPEELLVQPPDEEELRDEGEDDAEE